MTAALHLVLRVDEPTVRRRIVGYSITAVAVIRRRISWRSSTDAAQIKGNMTTDPSKAGLASDCNKEFAAFSRTAKEEENVIHAKWKPVGETILPLWRSMLFAFFDICHPSHLCVHRTWPLAIVSMHGTPLPEQSIVGLATLESTIALP